MSDYREDWTEIGREEWDGAQERIRAAAERLDWRNIPGPGEPALSAPMMPGEGIKAVIRELRLPKVSRVAWSHDLAPYGFYGIEAHYSNGRVQVFIVDRGSDCVPVVSYFWPTATATEGAKA